MSLKSTFSQINNLKLSKLIYANNLLLDVYTNKKSLQNDEAKLLHQFRWNRFRIEEK